MYGMYAHVCLHSAGGLNCARARSALPDCKRKRENLLHQVWAKSYTRPFAGICTGVAVLLILTIALMPSTQPELSAEAPESDDKALSESSSAVKSQVHLSIDHALGVRAAQRHMRSYVPSDR